MNFLPLLLLALLAVQAQAQVPPQLSADDFSWDRATIYEIVTDRFSNGNSDNNSAYGRGLDGQGVPYEVDSTGHFLGGDWDGIVAWMDDGWFDQLGVDVLLVSAPWEQVHGWAASDDGTVQQYGYDGRWPLDFTEPEEAFGTRDDFKRFVDRAHEAGLRVVLDVAPAAPGPLTFHDRSELGLAHELPDSWRSWRPSESASGWADLALSRADASPGGTSPSGPSPWWGSEWVHAGDNSFQLDVRVDSIPAFLIQKWGPEKSARERLALDSFFQRTGYPRTAAYHVVKWVTDWVAFAGVDGFRVYVPESLEASWEPIVQALGTEATRNQPDFVLVGDVYRATVPSDMLHAGPVHLIYGVETGRESPNMNWATYDEELLSSWRTLGQFRARHPAIGTGDMVPIGENPAAVGYKLTESGLTDAAVIVQGAAPDARLRINVSRIWPDDTALRDVMTGAVSIVSFGQIAFTPSATAGGLLLLEEVE